MNRLSVLLFLSSLLLSGCQDKEEEHVDWDRISQLFDEEESVEWEAPANGPYLLGQMSPEEMQEIEVYEQAPIR
ncbi:MAG: hypothetical protein EBZ47_07210 [Chlamydiae bacterium]|nr:hypothetical protein [Chlamydiota bacterium]